MVKQPSLPSQSFPDLDAFHREVQQFLGLRGEVTEFGVSRILHLVLEGRPISVGTNGSMLWLKADLAWSWFPEAAALTYAPESGYTRAKLLEEGTRFTPTQHSEFDDIYLLIGDDAAGVAKVLTTAHCRGLLDEQHLHPSVLGQEVTFGSPTVVRRVHLECQPDLRANREEFHSVAFGQEHFTAGYTAELVQRVASLANRLEGS